MPQDTQLLPTSSQSRGALLLCPGALGYCFRHPWVPPPPSDLAGWRLHSAQQHTVCMGVSGLSAPPLTPTVLGLVSRAESSTQHSPQSLADANRHLSSREQMEG